MKKMQPDIVTDFAAGPSINSLGLPVCTAVPARHVGAQQQLHCLASLLH